MAEERLLGVHEFLARSYPPQVRKVQLVVETNMEAPLQQQATASAPNRVAAAIVLKNYFDGVGRGDGDALAELGRRVAAVAMPQMLELLRGPARCYGKAVIVGTKGTLEDGAALIHPTLGTPMREAIGGGKSVIPSNAKVAVAGSSIDIPLAHKDDAWSFSHIDTLTLAVSDAPLADEMVLFLALASGVRFSARAAPAPASQSPA